MNDSESEIERITRRVKLPDGKETDEHFTFSTPEGEPFQVRETLELLMKGMNLAQVPVGQITATLLKNDGTKQVLKHDNLSYDYLQDVRRTALLQLSY